MLDRIKNLKKLWTLAKKDKKFLNALEQADLSAIPDEDSKVTFLPDMTEEDYQVYQRENIQGWKQVDDMVRKILQNGK